jgi:hypothetical protein
MSLMGCCNELEKDPTVRCTLTSSVVASNTVEPQRSNGTCDQLRRIQERIAACAIPFVLR